MTALPLVILLGPPSANGYAIMSYDVTKIYHLPLC